MKRFRNTFMVAVAMLPMTAFAQTSDLSHTGSLHTVDHHAGANHSWTWGSEHWGSEDIRSESILIDSWLPIVNNIFPAIDGGMDTGVIGMTMLKDGGIGGKATFVARTDRDVNLEFNYNDPQWSAFGSGGQWLDYTQDINAEFDGTAQVQVGPLVDVTWFYANTFLLDPDPFERDIVVSAGAPGSSYIVSGDELSPLVFSGGGLYRESDTIFGMVCGSLEVEPTESLTTITVGTGDDVSVSVIYSDELANDEEAIGFGNVSNIADVDWDFGFGFESGVEVPIEVDPNSGTGPGGGSGGGPGPGM